MGHTLHIKLFGARVKRRLPALMSTIAIMLVCAALPFAPAHADYPDRPIKMVVAWPAGSSTDAAARIVSERLAQRIGQPVTVENRPGASGSIGTANVAKAPADGYTLLFGTADTHSINPHVYKSLPYDALNGFVPITLVGTVDFVLIQSNALPYGNLRELVDAAKKQPGTFTYASWGKGSTAHVGFVALEEAAGIKLLHVPFQGAAPALNAVLGSQVDLMLTGAISADNQRKAGKVRILGTSGDHRLPWIPDVPTFAEQGVPNAQSGSWYGVLAPAGLPDAIRDRLANELVSIVKSDDVSQRIAGLGWNVSGIATKEFAQYIRSEYERYGKIIKAGDFQVD